MKDWPAAPEGSELASMQKNRRVGYENIKQGVQASVHHSALRGVIQSLALGKAAQFLQKEISSMLEKEVIRIIPTEHSWSGFYSRELPRREAVSCVPY